MFLLYNFLLTLLAPFWVPWVYLKSLRRKERPNWSERMGKLEIPPRGEKHRIWVHTVSVGEFLAATPILREMRKVLPDHEIVVSVTTSSGHQTAREAPDNLFDHLIYFPIDVARFQLAAMQQVRPDVVAIMETELWMNLLWAAKTFGARTMLVNGRISDRNFPRSMKVRFYYRALFKDLDICLMQTKTDADRVLAMGARKAIVLGNCKFDQAIEGIQADRSEWVAKLGLDTTKMTIVVGSTRGEDEEKFVLDALGSIGFERFNVVHAPRHLERVAALSDLVKQRTGSVALRSKGESGPYLILDTYGELSAVYSVADLVIVGGGFANLGGQNIIQPLALGKPVLHGIHMQNFRDVSAIADNAGAATACATPQDLATSVRRLLQDAIVRFEMGSEARQLVWNNVGASRRYAEAIAAEVPNAR